MLYRFRTVIPWSLFAPVISPAIRQLNKQPYGI